MCSPASFVVTRNKVLWSIHSDSHEAIIEENKVAAGLVDYPVPNFVRVEISPSGEDFTLPLEEWEMKVDQNELPSWFDRQEVEEAVREELTNWARKKLVLPGDDVVASNRELYVCGGRAELKGGSAVIYKGYLKAVDSKVTGFGGRIDAWDSKVECNRTAEAEIRGYSAGFVYHRAKLKAYNYSRVEAFDYSRVELHDVSVGVIHDSVECIISGNAVALQAEGGGIIEQYNGEGHKLVLKTEPTV